jgi:hypothetical protein
MSAASRSSRPEVISDQDNLSHRDRATVPSHCNVFHGYSTMEQDIDTARTEWWMSNLESIDRALARLAMLCCVRILDPGIIDRILQGDESVCRAPNSGGFRKLRNLLKLHLIAHDESAEKFGQLRTAAIERCMVERLGKTFPDLGLTWPPA